MDRSRPAFIGLDRAGAVVWRNPAAVATGAFVTCLDQCPAAVMSGQFAFDTPDPAPLRVDATGVSQPFELSAGYRRRVLAIRSAADAVVEEGDAQGRTWLRVIRADGERRIDVADRDWRWSQSPDGTVGVAAARTPADAAARLYIFARDSGGWGLVDDTVPHRSGGAPCVANAGTVFVTGAEPAFLAADRSRRVALATDLPAVSECHLGDTGGAALLRSSQTGTGIHTAVRGVRPDGSQTWSREYPGEAVVAVDPIGRYLAIAHGDTVEVLDVAGTVVRVEPAARSVVFTPQGELVFAAPDGTVRRLSL